MRDEKGTFYFIPYPSSLIPFSNSMHRVEEVFALRVDADAETLALFAKTLLQGGSGFLCARHVGDDNHRELALNDRLVNVNDAALGCGQHLRDSGDDARMVHAEDGDNQPVGRASIARLTLARVRRTAVRRLPRAF